MVLPLLRLESVLRTLYELGWIDADQITITDTNLTINYHIDGGKLLVVSGNSRESSGVGQITHTTLNQYFRYKSG